MRDGAMRGDTPTSRCEGDEDSQACRGTRQQPHGASKVQNAIVYWRLPYIGKGQDNFAEAARDAARPRRACLAEYAETQPAEHGPPAMSRTRRRAPLGAPSWRQKLRFLLLGFLSSPFFVIFIYFYF